MPHLTITDVAFTPAAARHTAAGLLGFLSLVVADRLRLDGVTLRRTRGGRLTLSFPERRDGAGRGHPWVCPIDGAARAEIETAVFDALGPLPRLPREDDA